jgi:hypothetical protein
MPISAPIAERLGRSIIADITVDYGPRELMSRFFLKADTAARERGVFLSFSTFDELLEVNRRNSETWKPIIPIFNSAVSGMDPSEGFCILGRNAAGDVVATQAARLYDWAGSNFVDEAHSLRMFYKDPAKSLPGEAYEVTAPSGREIRGRVVFSGGVWFRPDYRRKWLTAILPRISRAYAFTRWSTDCTMTMMAEGIVKSGMPARVGYRNVEWEVFFRNTPLGTLRFALMWMHARAMLDDLDDFLSGFDAQIDRRVYDRAG